MLAGMGQISLAGARRAGKPRQINSGSYQTGGEMWNLKGTRLSKSYNSRGGGHPLADKTTFTDKALEVPKVCWL